MNTSGINPLDLRVLVLPDDAETVTSGGIIIPPSTKEQSEYAMTKGTLVAVGACAWTEAKATRGFVAPEPGQRVLIAKYGGQVIEGRDGRNYRLLNDADIIGVLEEAA